jgi:hypothetical protein
LFVSVHSPDHSVLSGVIFEALQLVDLEQAGECGVAAVLVLREDLVTQSFFRRNTQPVGSVRSQLQGESKQ